MIELGGVALLPEWPLFASFALAGLALNIVPGADMTFIMTAAARGGRPDGVLAALGVGAGTLFHIFAAVLGLSAILAASETAFSLIKWVGAAYLLYLAVALLRSDRSATAETSAGASRSGSALFRSAALVNILNPKVAIFFLAFLPQFVDPDAAVPSLQILCLGLWFDFVGTAVNVVIALATAGTAAKLRNVHWLAAAARRIAATVMGGMAVKLALSQNG